MIEVDKTYYFILHAYYHYIATVKAIHGKRSITAGRCVRIHSHNLDFTEFWETGITNDTVWTDYPDGGDLEGWMAAFPYEHPIPKRKK